MTDKMRREWVEGVNGDGQRVSFRRDDVRTFSELGFDPDDPDDTRSYVRFKGDPDDYQSIELRTPYDDLVAQIYGS